MAICVTMSHSFPYPAVSFTGSALAPPKTERKPPEASRKRPADAPGSFIAGDQSAQQIFTCGANVLARGKPRCDDRRARMRDVPEVAVVGGRSVAEHGVDPGGI